MIRGLSWRSRAQVGEIPGPSWVDPGPSWNDPEPKLGDPGPKLEDPGAQVGEIQLPLLVFYEHSTETEQPHLSNPGSNNRPVCYQSLLTVNAF